MVSKKEKKIKKSKKEVSATTRNKWRKEGREFHRESVKNKSESLNKFEELRHKNIMEELGLMAKNKIKIFVRGDYFSGKKQMGGVK